ncbi:MAG TPA: ribosome small subunit-dependent GTPase A [Actinomycetota bacterium]
MLESTTDLHALGWTDALASALSELNDPSLTPGRVAMEATGKHVVFAPHPVTAQVSGKMQHRALTRDELPAVGDWVALRGASEDGVATIEALLPRRSAFTRKVAGFATDVQIVAANIDVVLVLASLEHEPNLRGIERYLTLAWQSGAVPAVILTKSDLSDDVARWLEEVTAIAPGADVHALSSITGEGVTAVRAYAEGNRTLALLGPSGVGKSTLVNALLGETHMRVQEIRDDGKGRHTTTHRELIPLPGGGALIDTPGMRELALWESDEGLDMAFEDIATLALECKFRDCAHESEPGCAVKTAVESGDLAPERLASYRKQLRELAALARKKDKRLASLESKKWGKIYREAIRDKPVKR